MINYLLEYSKRKLRTAGELLTAKNIASFINKLAHFSQNDNDRSSTKNIVQFCPINIGVTVINYSIQTPSNDNHKNSEKRNN